MTRSYALATKTFKRDFDAFGELCESIDRYVPGIRHYVLIDKADRELFRHFETPQRILIDCSELLPRFREIDLPHKRLWWRLPHRIVRGWIYQQIAKIEFASRREEDAIVMVDSDALLLRPLSEGQIFSGDRPWLIHMPDAPSGPPSESDKWHNVALELFGLPQTGYTGYDYISQSVIWSPDVVRAMIARIEMVTGHKWYDALIRHFRFSEYVLYGVFCEQLEGPHQQLVVPTDKELCHCSWHYDIDSPAGIENFVDSFAEHQIAVLIQSNLKLEPEKRQAIIRKFQDRVVPA